MQFDQDSISSQAELFLYLRSFLLSFQEIHEKKTPKQTTYADAYSAVCMLRVRQNRVRLSFANGAKMSEQFDGLKGVAKHVRYIDFTKQSEVDKSLLQKMIKESLLLNMEKAALRDLKKYL